MFWICLFIFAYQISQPVTVKNTLIFKLWGIVQWYNYLIIHFVESLFIIIILYISRDILDDFTINRKFYLQTITIFSRTVIMFMKRISIFGQNTHHIAAQIYFSKVYCFLVFFKLFNLPESINSLTSKSDIHAGTVLDPRLWIKYLCT